MQAINRIGLRVVLDVVYNHLHGSGPFDENSVLDKVFDLLLQSIFAYVFQCAQACGLGFHLLFSSLIILASVVTLVSLIGCSRLLFTKEQ